MRRHVNPKKTGLLQTAGYTSPTDKINRSRNQHTRQLDPHLSMPENTKDDSEQKLIGNQKVRWFLIFVATGLTILGFLALLLTQDFRVMILLIFPFYQIIKYYFPKQQK